MKRFAALLLTGSVQLTALAGNPVSVHPPAPAKPISSQGATSPATPHSLSQPLGSAVRSAAATMPATPAPTMTSAPTWGTPTVLPGTLVAAPTASALPCGDASACQVVKPYFNPLAVRPGCDVVRGSCLDRLKEWFHYRPTPGGFPCSPAAYTAPLRTYFPCQPTCGGGGCGPAGGAAGGCATGGGNCPPVTIPVQKLEAGCDTPACRPRVMYQPLTARSEVPAVGCEGPVRPRLFERLLGLFRPKRGGLWSDDACLPDGCATTPPPPATAVWTSPNPSTAPTTTWNQPTPPVPSATPGTLVPPMSTTPIYGPTPTGPKLNGRPIQTSPTQPFTNP